MNKVQSRGHYLREIPLSAILNWLLFGSGGLRLQGESPAQAPKTFAYKTEKKIL